MLEILHKNTFDGVLLAKVTGQNFTEKILHLGSECIHDRVIYTERCKVVVTTLPKKIPP